MTARKLFMIGYDELVSVVPPNAPLDPDSTIPPAARGKAPGIRYRSGFWGGYAWSFGPTAYEEAVQMDETGANIGLRARVFPAIDIDIKDEQLVGVVSRVVEESLGAVHYRVGQAPKRLYPFRLEGDPFPRLRVDIHRNDERYLVEVLGDGQQYLISGIHPSGCPYTWPNDLPAPSDLPVLSRKSAQATLEKIVSAVQRIGWEAELSSARPLHKNSDTESIIAPSLHKLKSVMESIPNTVESHPFRADYITVAIAAKAAGSKWPEEAYKAWLMWALKWPGRDGIKNTEAGCKRDWDSLKPPFRIGWSWLLDQARRFGFNAATVEFDPVEMVKPDKSVDPKAEYSEAWLKERVLEKCGLQVRYNVSRGVWYVWDGKIWSIDETERVWNAAIDVLTKISNAKLASLGPGEKIPPVVRSILSRRTVENVVTLMSKSPNTVVTEAMLDRTPYLLGTPAGVFDVTTGQQATPNSECYVTKLTSVAPDSGAPRKWLQFLSDLTRGDDEYVSYLQRICGYWLTGSMKEQLLWFMWGPGGNGKSVFTSTVMKVMGDYCRKAPMDAFMTKFNGHSLSEMSWLSGPRLVVASEAREGSVWDEGLLKDVSSGDKMMGRYLYHEPFEFEPVCKLLFVANARPELKRVDAAIRRRFRFLPATNVPSKINKDLVDELAVEAGRILNWMMVGTREWLKHGLISPRVVDEGTEEYMEDNDPLALWFKESCALEGEADFTALYESWISWCSRNEIEPTSKKRFSVLLRDRGFKRSRRKDGIIVEGVKLK